MPSKLVRLLIGLILGLAIGLAYGWLIRPVEYVDTTPDSLRADYRTDYVLMVAEALQADQDQELARIRLAALGPEPPETFVSEAIAYATEHDFGEGDLDLLQVLATTLQSLPPSVEIEGP